MESTKSWEADAEPPHPCDGCRQGTTMRTMRCRLYLFVVVLTLLVGAMTSLVTILPLSNKLKDQAKQELLSVVTQSRLVVDQYISNQLDVAAQVTSRTRARNLLISFNEGTRTREQLEAESGPILEDAMRLSPQIVGISRFSHNGTFGFQVGLQIPMSLWPSTSPLSGQILRGPERVECVLNTSAGSINVTRLFVVISSPILTPEGEFTGSDVVLFNVTDLANIVRDHSGLGEDGSMYLGQPGVSFFPSHNSDLWLQPLSDVIPVDGPLAVAMSRGQVERGLFSDDGHVYAYEPSLRSNWSIVASEDVDKLTREIQDDVIVTTVWATSIVLFLVPAALWFVLRPLTHVMIALEDELQQRVTERTRHLDNELAQRRIIESKLRIAKSQAEDADRTKSQFLSNMSHEIRTPLQGVLGMATLLYQSDLNPEQQQQLETILSSGQHLLAIISDILDFSKIESGKLELDRCRVELRSLVEGTVELVAMGKPNPNVDFLSFVEQSVPSMVVVDPTRLRQILLNLLGNAAKFTTNGQVTVHVTLAERKPLDNSARTSPVLATTHLSPDSKAPDDDRNRIAVDEHAVDVDVDSSESGDDADQPQHAPLTPSGSAAQLALLLDADVEAAHPPVLELENKEECASSTRLYLRVADSGVGIPAEKMDTIFDAFVQADNAVTRNYGGTGLGLAVSHRLAQLMGGHLRVTSSVGKGSTFHLEIPVGIPTFAKSARPRRERRKDRRAKHLLANRPVVVVDDNEFARNMLCRTFEGWGAQPCSFASGTEALAHVEKLPLPELMETVFVVDLIMPDMMGDEFSQRVRDIVLDPSRKREQYLLPRRLLLNLHEQLERDQSSPPPVRPSQNGVAKQHKPEQQQQRLRQQQHLQQHTLRQQPQEQTPKLRQRQSLSLSAGPSTALVQGQEDVQPAGAQEPKQVARSSGDSAPEDTAVEAMSAPEAKASQLVIKRSARRRKHKRQAASRLKRMLAEKTRLTPPGMMTVRTAALLKAGQKARASKGESRAVHRRPIIILLTSDLTSFSHMRQQERGAGLVNRVLGKPFKHATLLRTVGALLGDEPLAAPSKRTEIQTVPGRLGAPRVLLVDDNRVNQKVGLAMLERLGVSSCDIATNGLEAIEAAQTKPYDLILMDLMMPHCGGIEATTRIRGNPSIERQPHIVALTASAMARDRDAARKAGMDDFLTKPFDLNGLQRVLYRWGRGSPSTPDSSGSLDSDSNPTPPLPASLTRRTHSGRFFPSRGFSSRASVSSSGPNGAAHNLRSNSASASAPCTPTNHVRVLRDGTHGQAGVLLHPRASSRRLVARKRSTSISTFVATATDRGASQSSNLAAGISAAPEPADLAADTSAAPEPADHAADTSAAPEPADLAADTSAAPEPADLAADTSAAPEPADHAADTSAAPEPADHAADTSSATSHATSAGPAEVEMDPL